MLIRFWLILSLTALSFGIASEGHALLPANQVNTANFPGSVAIVLVRSLGKCTAVKIAPAIFLTAAHCFKTNQQGSEVSIEQVNKGEQTLEVRTRFKRIVIHPDYDHPNKIMTVIRKAWGSLPDFAIFQLAEDIPSVPIQRLNFSAPQLHQRVAIGGFGNQGTAICYPVLHPCSLNMASQRIEKVRKEFFYTEPSEQLPHFLTNGDSGGPVYIRNTRTRQLEVIGINSMIVPKNPSQVNPVTSHERPPEATSIYLRLDVQRDWITNTVRALQ